MRLEQTSSALRSFSDRGARARARVDEWGTLIADLE